MHQVENAEIVAIGTELLLGDVVDTNSAWLSRRLAALGVSVYRHVTVGDNPNRIISALKEAAARADLVLTTGGLGPTSDDLTIGCLAEAAGEKMVEFPEAREHVERAFARLGYTPPVSNYKQALFPVGATLLNNPLGTAMGAMLKLGDALVVTLPGVPLEMQAMFEDEVEPVIQEGSDGIILSRTLWFTGIGESTLAERVQDLLDRTSSTVAPLANRGMVRLRITSRARTREEARAEIEPVEEEILSRVGEYYFGADSDTLESVVGELLKQRGETLAVAESETGGLLAKRITDIPGASAYFSEGFVTYSNEAKERLLGVPHDLLLQHGAVSEEVARAMAGGTKRAARSTYGLAITGVAGPGGGTLEKPVGLVWLGLAYEGGVRTQKLNLSAWARSRESIREWSATRALALLRRHLIKQDPS